MQSQINKINMQQDSSMLNWFPKIKDILPVPKTEILEISEDEMFEIIGLLDGNMVSDALFQKVKDTAIRSSCDRTRAARSMTTSILAVWILRISS
jgi:hypothetical protein